MKNKITILIAEDHKMVRQGLISCLKTQSNYEIIGEASNGLDVIQKAQDSKPDIILMDINMPRMDGLEATRKILQINPVIKIILLTAHKKEGYILDFSRSGAKGYILKDAPIEELLRAIEIVYNGKTYFDPDVAEVVMNKLICSNSGDKDRLSILTPKEMDVLKFIAEGYINKEIAAKLSLSVKTVDAHREHIKNKLNIHTTAGLTKFALEKGLLKSSN